MNIIRFFILTFTLLSFSVEAAAPATHVYFAQLWEENNDFPKPFEEHKFIAGNLFPDIRYLGTVSRDYTHEKNVTPAKIRKSPNAFKAGMRLHAYVDDQRMKFVKKSKIHSQLKQIPKKMRVLFLKILEDEILWNQVRTQTTIQALGNIYQEELDSNAGEQTVIDWHNEMTVYFMQRPSDFLKLLAYKNQGFLKANPKTVEDWCILLPRYAEDPRFIEYTIHMVNYVAQEFIPKKPQDLL